MQVTRELFWALPFMWTTACGTAATPAGPTTRSNIRHVVVILQENHTFDTYFGQYCTAAAGSNPTCNTGPACCEAAPALDHPGGSPPVALSDASNGAYDPDHTQACESMEEDNGMMDRYVAGVTNCSNPGNFAVAAPSTVATYTGYAQRYALADRYFQPIVGQSSSNDMYFAVAHEAFLDNEDVSNEAAGGCEVAPGEQIHTFTNTTVGDVVLHAGFTFATYNEGLNVVLAVDGGCANLIAPRDCPAMMATYPCMFDPGDEPFSYYQQFVNKPTYIRDFSVLHDDIAHNTLPDFVFIRGLGYHSEHPGYGTTITAGQTFVDSVVQEVLASPYAENTLILLTWDEGGGFYDHITPPPVSTVDNQANGTRVPMLAIGRFARQNFVSHVPMEHSSIVKFIEWNFTGSTGQLGARDATVNNIGSMLDPTATGTTVPSN